MIIMMVAMPTVVNIFKVLLYICLLYLLCIGGTANATQYVKAQETDSRLGIT